MPKLSQNLQIPSSRSQSSVKVSKSQKQFLLASNQPKNKRIFLKPLRWAEKKHIHDTIRGYLL